MPRTRSIRRGIVLASASLAAALLAAELFLRYARPVTFMQPAHGALERLPKRDHGRWYDLIHRPSATAGLAYELAPSLDRVSMDVRVATNTLGMRDDEPLPRDTPGLFRILALGDSVTFGYRVDQGLEFCSRLEGLLAERGRRVEVLNTGVAGYSTRDEVAAFEHKWSALEPDLVLVGYVLNDPEVAPLQPLQRYFVAPAWWQRSELLRWVAFKLHGRRVHAIGGGNYYRYLHAVGEPSWRSVVDAFARLAELTKPRGTPVVVAVLPTISLAPWSDYPLRAEHAQVVAEARRHGFLAIDLLPRFEREEPRDLSLGGDDSHPNPRGHEIAASELARFLEEHAQALRLR